MDKLAELLSEMGGALLDRVLSKPAPDRILYLLSAIRFPPNNRPGSTLGTTPSAAQGVVDHFPERDGSPSKI